jgi:dolichol kinase
LASLVGNASKFKKFIYSGSALFFISAFLILSIFIKLPILDLVIIALIAAFVERISKYGTDNITIPLAVSLTLKLFL